MDDKKLELQCKNLGKIHRIIGDALYPRKKNLTDYQNAILFPVKTLGSVMVKAHKAHVVTLQIDRELAYLMDTIDLEDWEKMTDTPLSIDLQGAFSSGYVLGNKNLFDKTKLASKRKDAEITQTELAKLINVSQKDISRWETGEVKPKAATLKTIADALKCEIEDLID